MIRFTDLATNNHASPQGNTPPWPHIAKLNVGGRACAEILAELDMVVHAYKDAKKHCNPKENPDYQQSDHILQNACFENKRGEDAIASLPDYKLANAPCVCLRDGTRLGTEHGEKTAAQNAWTREQRIKKMNPTYKEVREANLNAMKMAKAPAMDDGPNGEHPAVECLRMVCDVYFKELMEGDDDAKKDSTQCRTPYTGEFKPATVIDTEF